MIDQIKNFNKQFDYEPEIIGSVQRSNKVIIAGMGGSHLAADLIKCRDPLLDLTIHKSYGLPPLQEEVLKSSLLIANSYSGNTEETVDFLDKAIEKKLNVVAVATGGKIIEIAKREGIPYVQIPATDIQPRSAVGFVMRALLKVMGEDNLLRETDTILSMNPSDFEEMGRELSKKIKNTPIVYASADNLGLALNWKVRLNETGKIAAFFNIFPELNHNEMAGFESNHSFHFIFLRDSEDHSRILRRMEVTKKLFKDMGLEVDVVDLVDGNKFEKIFGSIMLADWTSYHLAVGAGYNPEDIAMVEEFKKLI